MVTIGWEDGSGNHGYEAGFAAAAVAAVAAYVVTKNSIIVLIY